MTLSDRPGLGEPGPRTARVWQPLDLLHPSAGHGGFVRKAWSDRPLQAFDLQVVKTWSPPDDDEAVAESAGLADPTLLLDDAVSEQDAAAATLALTEEALETVRQTAYAEGLAEGLRQVREEWNDDKKSRQSNSLNILLELETSVRRLITSPDALFEPLKRLALHLAEQLVLAELTLSPQAIERLIRRCVDELAPQRLAPILVEVNSADLALLQPHGADASSARPAVGENNKTAKPEWPWHLQANDDLLPGSVRASASDAVVSDLIEHRLEALARSLLLDTGRSAAQSAFQPSRLSARMASEQVVDAQPRMPSAPETHRSFDADPGASAEPSVEAAASIEDEFSEPFTWNASDVDESPVEADRTLEASENFAPQGLKDMRLDAFDLPDLNLDDPNEDPPEPRDA
ncbi:MAG: FliH/SctL family protein [Polaromonas sp.]|nr:FliH/SctL family protein [Polaromonas sp.]